MMNAIYLEKLQHAYFRGNPFYQTTKQHRCLTVVLWLDKGNYHKLHMLCFGLVSSVLLKHVRVWVKFGTAHRARNNVSLVVYSMQYRILV